MGLAVIDLSTGPSLSIRGDERFPTASNLKVPVLFELFHQVERGRIRLTDALVMLEVDQVGGSGILKRFDTPLEITVRDAATFMISQSDNTATNLIIDPNSSRAFGLGVTTPMESARMFAGIYRGEAVSPEASRQMIAMLREQAWGTNEIPRYLPPGVVVAHKTGSVSATRNDCGIVYAQRPGGRPSSILPPPGDGTT